MKVSVFVPCDVGGSMISSARSIISDSAVISRSCVCGSSLAGIAPQNGNNIVKHNLNIKKKTQLLSYYPSSNFIVI